MPNRFSLENALTIDKGRVISRIKKDIIFKIEKYEMVCDQAEGAVHILYNYFNAENWSYRTTVNSNEKMKECMLRCSLAEFVGMEDALKHYVSEDYLLRISDSVDPVLHFVRELRNFEVHIKDSILKQESRKFMVSDTFFNMKDYVFETDIDIISIEEESLRKLRNLKRYSKEETNMMLSLFNDLQCKWGYQEVITSCVEKYCLLISEKYHL